LKAAVLDASVALKWLVTEAHSAEATRLLECGTEFFAPAHWRAEAATALWARAAVRGEMSEADAVARIAWLARLGVTETSLEALLDAAAALAFELHATPYDMLYLALAERLRVPMVTADRKLIDKVAGVPRLAPLIRWVGDL
jgi:predicted nucleic acid-binding protein